MAINQWSWIIMVIILRNLDGMIKWWERISVYMTTSITIFPLMGEPHCKVFHRWLTIWMNYGQQDVWSGNFLMWISGLHIEFIFQVLPKLGRVMYEVTWWPSNDNLEDIERNVESGMFHARKECFPTRMKILFKESFAQLEEGVNLWLRNQLVSNVTNSMR